MQYGQLFGLGEKAGLNIEGEQPGLIAESAPSDGLGMMTSFGEGFSMTPLELTAIVSAVANGGTLYYLQHPTSQAGNRSVCARRSSGSSTSTKWCRTSSRE